MQITQAKLFVNETKIVVETFALIKFKECLARCLVVPRFISVALLYGRKNVDQPFGLTGFEDDFLDPVIFAECLQLTDELDFIAIFISNALCIGSDLFRKGLGEILKIKNTDVVGIELAGHAFGMAPSGNITPDDHAVITGNCTVNFVRIFICK